jgi:hypothetical protein
VRVCVEDRCVTRQAKIGLWEMIFVPDPTLTGPQEVDVSIAVAQPPAENIALVDESAIVQTRRYQPNGPGCDPVVFAASVNVPSRINLDAHGRVTPVTPPYMT